MIFKRFFLFLVLINPVLSAINFSVVRNLFSNYVGEDGDQCPEKKKENCDENQLMLDLAKLYVISPERILLMLSKDSLPETCAGVLRTMNKVKKDQQFCNPLSPDNIYMKLFESVKAFHNDACVGDDRSKKLETYTECLKQLYEEYLDCEGPADWYEKTNHTIRCQIFIDIQNCNYIKTGELCGLDPAYLVWTISLDVFKPILPDTCSIPRSLPTIKNPMPPMPESKGTTIQFYKNVVVLLFFLIVLF